MPLNFSFLEPVHHLNAAKLKRKAKLAVGAKSISPVQFLRSNWGYDYLCIFKHSNTNIRF